EVGAAVAVHIGGLHTSPPAIRVRKARRGGAVHELAVLLVEHAHRHPFADDDQVQLPVTVVIDPRGARDHAGGIHAPPTPGPPPAAARSRVRARKVPWPSFWSR